MISYFQTLWICMVCAIGFLVLGAILGALLVAACAALPILALFNLVTFDDTGGAFKVRFGWEKA